MSVPFQTKTRAMKEKEAAAAAHDAANTGSTPSARTRMAISHIITDGGVTSRRSARLSSTNSSSDRVDSAAVSPASSPSKRNNKAAVMAHNPFDLSKRAQALKKAETLKKGKTALLLDDAATSLSRSKGTKRSDIVVPSAESKPKPALKSALSESASNDSMEPVTPLTSSTSSTTKPALPPRSANGKFKKYATRPTSSAGGSSKKPFATIPSTNGTDRPATPSFNETNKQVASLTPPTGSIENSIPLPVPSFDGNIKTKVPLTSPVNGNNKSLPPVPGFDAVTKPISPLLNINAAVKPLPPVPSFSAAPKPTAPILNVETAPKPTLKLSSPAPSFDIVAEPIAPVLSTINASKPVPTSSPPIPTSNSANQPILPILNTNAPSAPDLNTNTALKPAPKPILPVPSFNAATEPVAPVLNTNTVPVPALKSAPVSAFKSAPKPASVVTKPPTPFKPINWSAVPAHRMPTASVRNSNPGNLASTFARPPDDEIAAYRAEKIEREKLRKEAKLKDDKAYQLLVEAAKKNDIGARAASDAERSRASNHHIRGQALLYGSDCIYDTCVESFDRCVCHDPMLGQSGQEERQSL